MEDTTKSPQKRTSVFVRFRESVYRQRILLLAFLLPPFIMGIAYMLRGIFPVTGRDILIVDLYHQYAPFVADLQDKLRSFSSLLYSWTAGLGTSFLPLLAYYISSPINLLTVFFPKEFLTEAILFLVLVKVGLASGFFAIYLKGVYKEKNLAMVGFSLLYALSGFVMAYSWNIMWLDVIYLLPLIILGLVKLVRDGKFALYVIALALALISNFYMAFFACVFTLFYFPVCLFQYQEERKNSFLFKKTALFGGASLLGGGISAIIVLPTYFALQLSSAAGDKIPGSITQYYDLIDFISRHFTLAEPTIRDGMPNLYSGIIVLILVPVYFFSKSIRLREKLLHGLLLLFLILSFNTNVLNFLWHGQHFPNQLPYRFSFVYIFFVLSMCYKGFKKLDEFTGKQIGAICASVLFFILLWQKIGSEIQFYSFYASIIFIVVYAAAMTYGRARDNAKHEHLIAVLAFAMIAEIAVGTIGGIWQVDGLEGYTTRDGYSSGAEVRAIREAVESIEGNDDSFFRMEVFPPRTTNDPALYGYNGLSIFASTIQEKPVKLFENIGFHSNGINSYKYEGSDILADSFFGIKYMIYRDLAIDESMFRQIEENDEIIVFENPYVLPPGIHSGYDIKEWESGWSMPFDAQNKLYAALSGIYDILVPLDQEHGDLTNMEFTSKSGYKYYAFTRHDERDISVCKIKTYVEKSQHIYMYIDPPVNDINGAYAFFEGKSVGFNGTRATMVNLGYIEAGTEIVVQLTFRENSPKNGSLNLYLYGLEREKFEEAISIIKDRSMLVESFSDTSMSGTINAPEDGYMVMTIPYDKGWKVKVDGLEKETFALDNCLLSFEMAAGRHSVELKFIPDKFITGAIITVSSVTVLIAAVILSIRRKNSKKGLNNSPDK
ncbi:MAG: YfhO family protein [Eubacteriales bacterium]|nr:YfhO family protein [Eubacteriales bacterium]